MTNNHQSIIIPNGEIYLTGGKDSSTNKKRNEIFKYDSNYKALIKVASMAVARSSHSICYMSGAIYLVGGLSN